MSQKNTNTTPKTEAGESSINIESQSESKMSGVIGSIEIFNFDEDNFSEYLERFEYIFTVNGITDDNKKIALVMSMAGKEFYSKVTAIIIPKKPSEYTYANLMKELKKHFSPKTNLRYERYKFMSRQLGEHESLTDFIVDLKFLADTCDYKDALDQILCDKFIWSLRDSSMQKKLIDEPISKSFSEISTIALTMEMVSKNVDEIQGDMHRKEDGSRINKTFNVYARGSTSSRGYRNLRVSKRADSEEKPGLRDRRRESVEKDRVQCYKCQEFGHYSRECPNMRRRRFSARKRSWNFPDESNYRSRRVNLLDNDQIDEEEEHDSPEGRSDDEDAGEDGVYMNNLTMGQRKNGKNDFREPLILNIEIDDRFLSMEIDSGASFSVISKTLYKKFFKNKEIISCNIPLAVISGSNLKILGKFEVIVHGFQNSPLKLFMIVIDTKANFLPLMGRDWLDRLFPLWKNCFKINSVSSLFDIRNLKNRFPKVFDGDYTGTIKGHEAHIVMEGNPTPVFCGAYTVPYGLRSRVDQEIQRLIECEILEPVTYSDWASPMVVVQKSNGSLRLCIDCKVSINKFVKNNYYSLPLVDDLLNDFQGCSYFSLIDLIGAFTQLTLSRESQQYLTINTQQGLYRSKRLAFGVKSAPCIFQNVIDNILRNMKYVRPYLDDILIGG